MERRLLVGVCAWELAALTVGRPRTITSTVWASRGRQHEPYVVAVVCGAIGWCFWHLILEGRPIRSGES